MRRNLIFSKPNQKLSAVRYTEVPLRRRRLELVEVANVGRFKEHFVEADIAVSLRATMRDYAMLWGQ